MRIAVLPLVLAGIALVPGCSPRTDSQPIELTIPAADVTSEDSSPPESNGNDMGATDSPISTNDSGLSVVGNSEATKIVRISAVELWNLLKGDWDAEDRPVFINLSNAEEHANGHLTGSRRLSFPGEDFEAKIEMLDRDKPYLIYCQDGDQSAKSLPIWQRLNFGKIYYLKGGWKAYVRHISE
jgi:rhodanese-related sulfurtransferase